jgi:Transglutaminase-like superfamily
MNSRAFAAVLAEPEPSLLDGALCIAAIGGRAPDRLATIRSIDAVANAIDGSPNGGASIAELISGLCSAQGFRGARERYDDPRNSLIDLVVERRVGIPITLAIVMIEVGRRCGAPLQPIGMPGHFLVGSADEIGVFGDPFHGRVLDEAGCADIVRRWSGGQRSLRAVDLEPVSAPAVFARMLNNLAAGPWGRTFDRLGEIVDLHCVIDELPPPDRLALIGRLEHLGRFADAAQQLDRLASEVPAAARSRLKARASNNRARYN